MPFGWLQHCHDLDQSEDSMARALANESLGLLAYLVAVVPEEVVGFLPGVPHHTGQVESAPQLNVDLRAAHDLSSGL